MTKVNILLFTLLVVLLSTLALGGLYLYRQPTPSIKVADQSLAGGTLQIDQLTLLRPGWVGIGDITGTFSAYSPPLPAGVYQDLEVQLEGGDNLWGEAASKIKTGDVLIAFTWEDRGYNREIGFKPGEERLVKNLWGRLVIDKFKVE